MRNEITASLLIAALVLMPALGFAKTKLTETPVAAATSLSLGAVKNPVNVNTASEAELTALFSKKEYPEHAEVDAKTIVKNRPMQRSRM